MSKLDVGTREAVILAAVHSDELFGRQVRDAYRERTGKAIALGTLYVTLERLEQAGLITGRDGEPDPGLGGNRRRFYRSTLEGRVALDAFRYMTGPRLTPPPRRTKG